MFTLTHQHLHVGIKNGQNRKRVIHTITQDSRSNVEWDQLFPFVGQAPHCTDKSKTGQNKVTNRPLWSQHHITPPQIHYLQTHANRHHKNVTINTEWTWLLWAVLWAALVWMEGRFPSGLQGFYPWEGVEEKEEGYCHSQSPWSIPAPCLV